MDTVTQPEKIRSFVLQFGVWSLAVYFLLSIMVIVIPPLPNEIVPVVGGMIFGFWPALILGLLARITGSTINYILGKQIRNGVYIRFINIEDQQKLKRHTENIGWQTVFLSRFTPSIDIDLIAYIAGIANMKYIPFIVASFCGMIVPVAVMIFVGSQLLNNKIVFYILIISYIVGVLFAHRIIKWLSRSEKCKK